MNGEDIWPVQGPTIPEWNPSEPLRQFQEYARDVHEKAKHLLLRDGRHAEMLFFIGLDGQCHIVQWQGSDPDAKARWMRKHIQDHYIYGVIHICECWIRIAKGPNDPITSQLVAGKIRVSELPRQERIEALSVVVQTRDGYSHTWVEQILRDESGQITGLGNPEEFDNMGGRFGELFK